MMSNLEKFLVSLSEDSNTLSSYQENPKTAMEEAGLSHEEQVMVLTGDTAAIEKAIGRDVDSVITIIIRMAGK